MFGMNKTNVAIIGNNFGAKVHLPAFKAIDDVNIVSICSRNWMSIIEDPSVQAVSVAVPPLVSYDILSAAINHGKHIFCEKPLCANLKQAQEIVASLHDNIIHMINFEMVADPVVQRLQKLLRDRILGQINHFDLTWKVYGYGQGWKLNVHEGGGTLHNYCSHIFHLLEWLFDQSIHKLSGNLLPSAKYNTYMMADIQFNDFDGLITIDNRAPVSSGLELVIYCQDGKYILRNEATILGNFSLYKESKSNSVLIERDEIVQDQDTRIKMVHKMASQFIAGVRNNLQVSPNIIDGLRAHVLADILLS